MRRSRVLQRAKGKGQRAKDKRAKGVGTMQQRNSEDDNRIRS